MKNLLIVFVLVVGAGPGDACSRSWRQAPIRVRGASVHPWHPVPCSAARGGPAQGVPFVTIKWTTSTDEIEGKDWSDLATKLKRQRPRKTQPN